MNKTHAIYLLVTALTGGTIMAMELAGHRLMAPIFGGSIITWTAIIAVVLLAISLGGMLGGILSERVETNPLIAVTSLGSGIWIALILIVHEPVMLFFRDLGGNMIGSLLACILLFALPSAALAAITPACIRTLSLSTGKPGLAAGFIGMSGTLGSLAGTLGAGFFSIPWLGAKVTLVIVGGTLLVIGLGLLPIKLWAKSVTALAFTLGCLGFAWGGQAGYFERDSIYQNIRIKPVKWEQGEGELLLLNGQQASLFNTKGEESFNYVKAWELRKLLGEEPLSALYIGGGGGIIPHQHQHAYPQDTVTVVEIDGDLIDIVKDRYQPHPAIQWHAGDAREFLINRPGPFRLIFCDAYYGKNSIPVQLTTREFFELVKAQLTPDGIAISNIISAPPQAGSSQPTVLGSLVNTIKGVFKYVDVYTTRQNSSPTNNFLVIASNEPPPKLTQFPIFTQPLYGPVLTDEVNPIELIAIF